MNLRISLFSRGMIIESLWIAMTTFFCDVTAATDEENKATKKLMSKMDTTNTKRM